MGIFFACLWRVLLQKSIFFPLWSFSHRNFAQNIKKSFDVENFKLFSPFSASFFLPFFISACERKNRDVESLRDESSTIRAKVCESKKAKATKRTSLSSPLSANACANKRTRPDDFLLCSFYLSSHDDKRLAEKNNREEDKRRDDKTLLAVGYFFKRKTPLTRATT